MLHPIGSGCGVGTADVYNLTTIYEIPKTDPGWNDLTPLVGPTYDALIAVQLSP